MSLQNLQDELTLQMDELVRLCQRYGYDVRPTILLMHKRGPEQSILISNCAACDIKEHVDYLSGSGKESDSTPAEAANRLLLS